MRLGLPDGVRACLFDLDGVLTETASVHAAAWKEMFDDFLAASGGTAPASRSSPSTSTTTTTSTSTASRASTACGTFWPRATSTSPRAVPTIRPDADTVHGLGERKNDIVLRRIHEDGVEAYPGSVAYVRCRAGRRSGAGGRLVVEQLPGRAGSRRDRGSFPGVVDGVVAEREHLQGKPAPDTFLAAARLPRRRAGGRGGVRGRPGGRGAAGRAGHFGWVVGVDRVGQAEALVAHGADRVVEDLAELLAGGDRRDRPPGVSAATPGRSSRSTCISTSLAQTESVFALSNGHIGLRGNLDEGEPHGLPGTYLGSLLRAAAPAAPEAGVRRARHQPDRGQRDQRQDHPACSSTTSPSTSATASCASHERVLDLRAGHAQPHGRVGVARAPDRAGAVDPAGVVYPAGHRRHLLRGGGRRPGRSVGDPVRAGRQRGAARRAERRSARWRQALDHPLLAERGRAEPMTDRFLLIHRTSVSGLRVAAMMDHEVVEAPGGRGARDVQRSVT